MDLFPEESPVSGSEEVVHCRVHEVHISIPTASPFMFACNMIFTSTHYHRNGRRCGDRVELTLINLY